MSRRLKIGPISPFDTRDSSEKRSFLESFRRPFSGYLGGIHTGGYWVERLSDEWKGTFRCKYAIPCNSATSGLLAACMAAEIGSRDKVLVPAYTMSATAACAKVLGANVRFLDIESDYFSMDIDPMLKDAHPKAIIITNLFGHPALYLTHLRRWCDKHGVVLIEDNAQSPMAKIDYTYTGTIGHMGVFSLNVHKHIQTGEGGVVVTNDGDLALRLKDAINHGELRGGNPGLNLRMTEPIAAMACSQLGKLSSIVESRRDLAHALTDMVKDIPFIEPPKERVGSRHVYYIWAAKIPLRNRDQFVMKLHDHGIPFYSGYSPPLNRVFKFNETCEIAERMEDRELISFDVCSYSPKRRQLQKMKDVIHKVAESLQ